MTRITNTEREEEASEFADTIKNALDAKGRLSLDEKVELICTVAEELAAEYPIVRGERVLVHLCNYLTPLEIAALDEHYLPGIIDDAISYAKQSVTMENAQ